MERSSLADNIMLKTETYELLNNADCRKVAPQLPTRLPLQSLSHMHVKAAGCNINSSAFSCGYV